MEYTFLDISQAYGGMNSDKLSDDNIVAKICDNNMIIDSSKKLHCKLEDGKSTLYKIKKAIYDWAENTTFHGVKYVFDSRASTLRRFFWLLIILGMWTVLIFTGIAQYNRYFDYQTVTQDTFRLENQLAFPAVSICNQCIYYNVTGKYEDYKLIQQLSRVRSKEDFERLKKVFGPRLRDNTSIVELYEGLGTPSDVFLYRCVWSRSSENCFERWKATTFGRYQCFTFNGDVSGENVFTKTIGRQNGALSMTVFLDQANCLTETLRSGIVLAIHEVGVEPDMSVSMELSPGFYHNIAVSVNERTFLPPPVKAFGTSECLDTDRPAFVNPLKFSPRYFLSACEYECFSMYVNATCGCVIQPISDQLKLCDVLTDRTCATPAYRKFKDDYNNQVALCGCRERCKYTTYTKTVSSSNFVYKVLQSKPNIVTEEQISDKEFVRDNFLAFDVYLDSKVIHVTKQILDFTLSDLGASIGGFFGLAIGASVLTFCEIFDMAISLAARLLKNLVRA